MAVRLLAAHQSALIRLYRQRVSVSTRDFVPGVQCARLDQRLIGHLHACTQAAESLPDDLPDDPAEAFAAASPALRNDPQGAMERLAPALEEAEGDQCQGLVQAVALTTPPDGWSCVMRGYERYPEARASLLEAFEVAAAHVPDALLNEALESPEQQAAALRCASLRRDWPVERFRPWYRSDLTEPATLPALRAGLLRDDPEAADALLSLLDGDIPLEETTDALRLNALLCPDHLSDAVWRAADEAPETGLWLLALSGRRDAAEQILQALRDARASEPAAAAWRWLTGQALPHRDRLQVVNAPDRAAAGGPVPDAGVARQWWDANAPGWDVAERRILGGPGNPERVATLATRWAGRAGDALMDLAALQEPGPYVTGGWFHRRGEPGPVLPESQEEEVADAAVGQ
ncbi:hypothetical protein [Aquisalimonas asiatica]|uniref:TIGR02270 family protein n=1 Tax=Aquisalimonas asiatica TaxID=406100 RepID=A0A1H8V5Z1_9GAMM|nr:hypothetical protein [Aquisalimonas asiatica]SEP10687.1 hypothetical protein SAMN04488052_1107 [Aquisalimonas asiatica]